MSELAQYGDGRTFELPDQWPRATDEVLETARAQVLAALGARGIGNLTRYYDREGAYAGTLFLDAEPNDADVVGPADLYAVTTLSMRLDARHGRLLLDRGDVRSGVRRQLHGIEVNLPITALEHGDGGSAETLQRMWELQTTFRGLLGGNSNRWVTASKLCARKRPLLFPVRDNLVCTYLGGGQALKSGSGRPGDFSIDLQVYAYVMSSPGVVAALSHLRGELDAIGVRVDESSLRLLDSALWMAADGTIASSDAAE